MSEAKRQLKIKTGSVKRLAKEVVMYQKDQETETDRVARMKAAGSDASDIKHAVRPLQCSNIWYDETFFARTTTQNFPHVLSCPAAGAGAGRGSYDGP